MDDIHNILKKLKDQTEDINNIFKQTMDLNKELTKELGMTYAELKRAEELIEKIKETTTLKSYNGDYYIKRLIFWYEKGE